MQVRSSHAGSRAVRRAHLRSVCTGGSAVVPDPLVMETAEHWRIAQADTSFPDAPPVASVSAHADHDDLTQIDEQLLIAANEPDARPNERDAPVPCDPSVLALMAHVQLPS